MPGLCGFPGQIVERGAPELTMSHRAKGLWSSTNNFYFLSRSRGLIGQQSIPLRLLAAHCYWPAKSSDRLVGSWMQKQRSSRAKICTLAAPTPQSFALSYSCNCTALHCTPRPAPTKTGAGNIQGHRHSPSDPAAYQIDSALPSHMIRPPRNRPDLFSDLINTSKT